MPSPTIPSFDDWVSYCFEHGYSDFSGTSPEPSNVVNEREARFARPRPPVIADYLTRLCENPSFIADRYSDKQIADATWFIFGIATTYIGTLRSSQVHPDKQVRCIRSIATAYTDLFDRVCGKRGQAPDEDLRDTNPIDTAVYMMWDMDGGLDACVLFPEKAPHLLEPALSVLETVLTKCVTSGCLVSALHGIGHLIGCSDARTNARLQRMVDNFLSRRRPPDWLREYAEQAREGSVM